MSSWKLVAGAIVRHALSLFFTYLVTKGIIDQNTANSLPVWEMAVGVVGILGTVGWSLWQKASAKWKFLQALRTDPGVSPKAAEKIIEGKPKTIPGTINALTGGPIGGGAITSVILCLVLVAPLMSCTSGSGFHIPIGGGDSSSTQTIYRKAENARTVLIAMQTARYHWAELVATAYMQGRITKAQSDEYARYDNGFRIVWQQASDLVALWLNSGAQPKALQNTMNAVETKAAALEGIARGVE